MKNAVIFPGQGAQVVGMGKDFFDGFSAARHIFEQADDILSMHLSKDIFQGPSETLMQTKICQPALFVVSAAILHVIKAEFPHFAFEAAAGLSLGEYTALYAAGGITFADALKVVKKRGELMHSSSLKNPGSLSVILGKTAEEVEEILANLPSPRRVWVANLNCPGQVVISGSVEGLKAAAELAPKYGVKRILSLDVSGAFHSPMMEEARLRLEEFLASMPLNLPKAQFVMNATGRIVHEEGELRENLAKQLVSPVLWEKTVRLLDVSGVEYFVEIGSGKTLAGMNKRIGVRGKTISIEKTTDLKQLEEMYAIQG